MVLNTLIHVMEACAVVLSLLMLYRLYSAYQKDQASQQGLLDQKLDRVALNDEVIRLNEENASFEREALVSPAKASVQARSQSQAILDDYIGEFFGSTTPSPQTDINAYRENAVNATSASPAQGLSEVSAEQLAAYKQSQSAVVEENVPVLEPVLMEAVELTAEEEESFIVVEDQSRRDSLTSNEDVMSDKVVHAMLKEAKLAFPS